MASETAIIRGYLFSIDVQIVNDLLLDDGAENPIVSSTADLPAKVTLKEPHGLTAQNIVIRGHLPNHAINGNHAMVPVDGDPYSFTLTGVQGLVTANGGGQVSLVNDMTGKHVVLVIREYRGGPALSLTIGQDWIAEDKFNMTVTLAPSETTKLPICDPILTVSWGTTSAATDGSIDIPLPSVVDA